MEVANVEAKANMIHGRAIAQVRADAREEVRIQSQSVVRDVMRKAETTIEQERIQLQYTAQQEQQQAQVPRELIGALLNARTARKP